MTQLAAVLGATNPGEIFGPIIGFIVWIAIMVWVYNIARRKGRHPVGWTVLAFFFSILALVLILLLPSKRTTEAAQRS